MEQKLRQIVRVANVDLDGNKNVYNALRKIKGVSFMFANAVCQSSGINRDKKTGLLDEGDIKKLEDVLLNYKALPKWLLNRRKDFEEGTDKHIVGAQVQFVRGFDIKRMQETKSNRGLRHAKGLPVRGQRTRAHFRGGRSVGVMKKAAKMAAAKAATIKPAKAAADKKDGGKK
ncbi:MAG TPA: 30S ribosomal protein S13 [Candidatus Nanoarchaeia archaeon]|nr:30S ribosomal protein S13 [Candidatus Nanoarchaeia archaeon]